MKEQIIERMNSYFEERIAECDRRGRELSEDGRGDETVFERIRANVYDIFRTVLAAADKACGGDEEKVCRFYIDRLEKIPSGWVTSYENAVKHDDAVKMQIESIKLDTVAEIREYFNKISEEA